MEPYDRASVPRTCHRLVAHRGVRLPCQNLISELPSLFSRPCCQLLGMQLRKVAVAVAVTAVVAVVTVAVVMVEGILAVAAMVVGILAAALTSVVVVATWVGDRRAPVRLGGRIPAATT